MQNLTEEERTFEFTKDKEKRTFIYDVDKMSMAQISDANTKFSIYESMVSQLPTSMNEYQEMLKRDILNKAFAALLIETEKGDIKYPIYKSSTHTGLEAMENLIGLETYQKLEACKANFFMRQGRISVQSITQLATAIEELTKNGVSQDTQKTLFQIAAETGLKGLENTMTNSIPEDIVEENTEDSPAVTELG